MTFPGTQGLLVAKPELSSPNFSKFHQISPNQNLTTEPSQTVSATAALFPTVLHPKEWLITRPVSDEEVQQH